MGSQGVKNNAAHVLDLQIIKSANHESKRSTHLNKDSTGM
jgi:hypothetical protein